MILTPQQIKELDIASQRQAAGDIRPLDTANLAYAQQQFGYVYTPQTIAADSLTPIQPVSVGTPEPSVTGANSMAAGGTTVPADIQSYISAFTAPQTAEQQQADSLTKSIRDLIGQTGGQAEALATEEQQRGVSDLQNQLTSVNADITSQLAEYEALRAEYDKLSIQNRGTATQTRFLIGNEQQIQFERAVALNQKAASIGLAQAQALGLQGRIDNAKLQAQKAVELKYAPILESLAIKQAQLEALTPILNRQETIQALALRQMYDDQLVEAKAQQAEEQQLADFALDAMNKYRDAGIRIGDSYETIQNKIQLSGIYQTEQAQEVASLQRTQRLAGGGGGGVTFTPTEKKKLEQAGLTGATRQEQLDYLYGKEPSTDSTDFYVRQILDGSPEYVNDDGTVNWSAIPAAQRLDVFDLLEASQVTEEPKVGVLDVIKELPGAAKGIVGKVGSYIKNFFNLF